MRRKNFAAASARRSTNNRLLESAAFALLVADIYIYVYQFVDPQVQQYYSAESAWDRWLVKEFSILMFLPVVFSALGLMTSLPFFLENNSEKPQKRIYHAAILLISCIILINYLMLINSFYTNTIIPFAFNFIMMLIGILIYIIHGIVTLGRFMIHKCT